MEICSVEEDEQEHCLEKAVRYLRDGKVVCFPTETFYAIGALYDNEDGLMKIAVLKNRPRSKAFSLIIGSRKGLALLAEHVTEAERKIMDQFWPGPLTLIFRAKAHLLSYIKDERGTVAVRMPGPSFALDLARRLSVPVTATSANVSGLTAARNARDVKDSFPKGIDLLIDGGECAAVKPSTIIEVIRGKVNVLRKGIVEPGDLLI